MRKLTKDQRYYRKRKKASRFSGRVSLKAFERLEAMAQDAEITKKDMLNRVLINHLCEHGAYYPIAHPKKRYKRAKGNEKQLTCEISTAAYYKLDKLSRIAGFSKARIVETSIITYKPLTAEQKEKQLKYREKNKAKAEFYRDRALGIYEQKLPKKRSKFIHCGYGFFKHYKGIPAEKWDDDEVEEYFNLTNKWIQNNPDKHKKISAQINDEWLKIMESYGDRPPE